MSLPKPYYQDDSVTIYHGDCRVILPDLPKVDLVLTDPPYAVSKKGVGRWEMRYGRTIDLEFFECDLDWNEIRETVKAAISFCADNLPQNASIYAWVGHRQFGSVIDILESKGWSTRFLVWSKACPIPPAPGSGFPSAAELCVYAYRPGRTWTPVVLADVPRSNVLVADAYRYGQPGKVDHPTQKPFEVITPLIECSSYPLQIVLDPFMGSGTTLRAAKDLGRKAIGIEIEERYCEIAAKRMAQECLPFESSSIPKNDEQLCLSQP